MPGIQWFSVSRKRLTTWVLLVAVGLAARITVAAPRAAITELRAVVCCAEHCPKTPRPPMTPRRCCFVDSAANDPASPTAAPSLGRPDAAPLALLAIAPAATPPRTSFARLVATALRDGPRAHLDTLKLRC